MPRKVRFTLIGLASSVLLGVALGLALGPPVLPLKIPFTVNLMGLLSGTFALGVALGLVFSESYAAAWKNAAARLEKQPPRTLKRWVWIGTGAVFASMAALKYCQYASYQAHTDLAIFTNVCWQTLHGRILQDGVKGFDSYLGDHFSPVLVLFAPLLWLWKSALILQYAQSFLLALSIPGAYRLARSHGSSQTTALSFALMLAVNPYFHKTASAYFEPSTLAVPVLIWAFVAWRSGHKAAAGGLVLLTLTLKEEAPFALLGLGIYLILRGKRERGHGVLLALAAIVSFVLITQVIIPHYLPLPVQSRHLYLFSNQGSTYSEIVLNVLRHPFHFMAGLVWPLRKWTTPLSLLFSVGFLPFGAPLSLVPAAVTLLPHQMSSYDGAFGYQALSVHYAAFPLALLVGSAAAGLGCLKERLQRHLSFTLAGVCVVAAYGLLTLSPYVEMVVLNQQRLDAAAHILRLVPDEASVWAPTYFVAHLACRDHLKTLTDHDYLMRGYFVPDRIILDKRAWPTLPEGAKKDILLALKKARYHPAAEDEGVTLLVKINP